MGDCLSYYFDNIYNPEFPSTLEKTKNYRFINRVKLGNIVFNNKKLKRNLENIIHPQIGRERKKWMEQAIRRREKIICYDVPLLFETKGEKAVDEVIVVSAPHFIQRQRALKRKNMDSNKLNNILKFCEVTLSILSTSTFFRTASFSNVCLI